MSVLSDAAEFVAELDSVVELAESLIGPEGAVVPPLLTAAPASLGFDALFGAMLLVAEPLVLEFWANTIGAKAATDNANPAPSK